MIPNFIRRKVLNTVHDIVRSYMIEKYGPTTIVCMVVGTNDGLIGYLDNTNSIKVSTQNSEENPCVTIRSSCGSHVMLRYGIPKDNPHTIVLLPTPSIIKTLGIRKFSRFLKDWSGISKLDTLDGRTIVKYVMF
jgi:hypothetical protein